MNHRIVVSLGDENEEIVGYWFDLQVGYLVIKYLHCENSPYYTFAYILFYGYDIHMP